MIKLGGSDVVLVGSPLAPGVKDVGELPTVKEGKPLYWRNYTAVVPDEGGVPELRRFDNMLTEVLEVIVNSGKEVP